MSSEIIGVRDLSSRPVCPSLSPRVSKHKAIDFMEKAFKREEGASRPLKSRCKAFAQGLKAGYADGKIMMIFFEVIIAIPGRLGKIINVTAHIPVLAFAALPIYLYHTTRDTIVRYKTVYSACKVSRWSDAFYNFLGGSSRGGFAGGIATKPVEQGFKWAGMGADPVVNLVFKRVLPQIFLVTSAMSGIRKVWDMTRTVKAYRLFKKDAKEQRTLGKVFEIFENHWDVPSEMNYKFEKDIFKGNRATNNRYKRLKGESDILKSRAWSSMKSCFESFDLRIQALKTHPEYNEIPEVQKLVEWHTEVRELKELIEASEILPAISKQIGIIEELIEELSNSKDERFETVKERLMANKSELEALLKQGDYVVDRMTSEMHRKLVYHSLESLMSILMISGSALALTGSSQLLLIGTSLTLSSAIIDIIYIIFYKLDDEEGFRKIESLFRDLTPAPDQLVALPEA